ncbi:MAG: hypothetical protein EBS01_07180 [Verrucomicrobia bacterium]|nr:hypothetical protein [Verrucomicrobiota bacterium]
MSPTAYSCTGWSLFRTRLPEKKMQEVHNASKRRLDHYSFAKTHILTTPSGGPPAFCLKRLGRSCRGEFFYFHTPPFDWERGRRASVEKGQQIKPLPPRSALGGSG